MATVIDTESGPAVDVDGRERRPYKNATVVVYPGNDDFPRAYALFAIEIPEGNPPVRKVREYSKLKRGLQYHIIDEAIGYYSEDFLDLLRGRAEKYRVTRGIILSSDKEMQRKIRKRLGVPCRLFEDKKLNYGKVVIVEWLSRRDEYGEPLLKIWGPCREVQRANYPPVRWCMTRLLEFFDQKYRARNNIATGPPERLGGYS